MRKISRAIALIYSVCALLALCAAYVLDAAFFRHWESSTRWYQPLQTSDVLRILSSFTIGDAVHGNWLLLIVIALAVATTIAIFRRSASPWIRLSLALPQVLLIAFMPVLAVAAPSGVIDLFRLWKGHLDTEWLHEALFVWEALSAWLVVPVFVTCAVTFRFVTRAMRRTREAAG